MEQNNTLNFKAKRAALNTLLGNRLEDLLAALDIRTRRLGKVLTGACHVHGGDRTNAFILYPEGSSLPGYWRCYTGNCQNTFIPTPLGLIRGILSHRELGYSRTNCKAIISFKAALDWSLQFLGKKFHEIKVDLDAEYYKSIVRQVKILECRAGDYDNLIQRSEVRTKLVFPPEYLIKKGFNLNVLRQYDVGYCDSIGKEMYGRVVVPVYDDTGQYLIGCLGRATSEECGLCKGYHEGVCPSDPNTAPKWRVSGGFDTGTALYNYWEAIKTVKDTKTLYIVEGSLDSLKLIEAEFINNVSTFGVALTDYQQIILEKSGFCDIVICLDNDEAGHVGAENMRQKLSSLFNVTVKFPPKDFKKMSITEIKEFIHGN